MSGRSPNACRRLRAPSLFGERGGIHAALQGRLAGARRELHAVRRARHRLGRDREVPWFHYQWHFADVCARGGFDLVMCGLASNRRKQASDRL